MQRIFLFSILCLLLITLTTFFIPLNAQVNKPAPTKETASIDLDNGPVMQSSLTDDMFDWLLFELCSPTFELLGIEYVDTTFYLCVCQMVGLPMISANGTFYPQPDTMGWGWRDLTFDGTYLYGSSSYLIEAFDRDVNLVPEMNINGPITPCRALAYDPVLDHFWTASYSSHLYEFDRMGTVIWTGIGGQFPIVGAAWDDMAPDGPWLWLFIQDGDPPASMVKFDPINHEVVEIIQLEFPWGTDWAAGGLAFTTEWDNDYSVLCGTASGTWEDAIFCLEMYQGGYYTPAAPENFTVVNNGGELRASLAWDLPTTTGGGEPIGLYPITEVKVCRDGNVVATLAATATSFDNYVPQADLYEYSVYCVNSEGLGAEAFATEPIGLDVPAGISDLFGMGVGTELEAELSWTNPDSGAYGGYFPPGSIDGYTINRYGPFPATFNVSGMTTSYLDNTVPQAGWYHYGVSAYNTTGSGPETMTDDFFIGSPSFEIIPFNWIEINPNRPGGLAGTNAGITNDDQNVGPFPIGFTFPFISYNTFDAIRLCSNGFASFTSTATAFTNAEIPNPAEPNNLVAPYWDDLNPNTSSGGHGTVWYYCDPANDFFIAEWDSMVHYGSNLEGDYFTFQLILYPCGDIDFMYKDIEAGTLTPFPSATVGIEDAEGDYGIQVTYDGSGPLEPQSEMGIRIFAGPTPPPSLEITLTPYNPPIIIQSTGGSFDFNIALTNNESITFGLDAWIDVVLPNGQTFGPVLGPVNLELPAMTTIDRDRTQDVPANAPPGDYTYTAKIGIYPFTIWDEDMFQFEKLTTGDGRVTTGWENSGENFDKWLIDHPEVSSIPAEFTLSAAYPNPFNPTTTIGFTLPMDERVTLKIYDITGSLITTIIDGWRTAGTHVISVNGSCWASGVYLYHLKAGNYIRTKKMVLTK